MFVFTTLGTIITPDQYLGSIISLCLERRGVQRSAINIDNERVMLQYDLPLCEVVVDFHDSLKTISSGYASFDYESHGYESSNVVKVKDGFRIVNDSHCYILGMNLKLTSFTYQMQHF